MQHRIHSQCGAKMNKDSRLARAARCAPTAPLCGVRHALDE
jgi:hypothetical protein